MNAYAHDHYKVSLILSHTQYIPYIYFQVYESGDHGKFFKTIATSHLKLPLASILAKFSTLWMNLYDTLSEILHVQSSILICCSISMQVLSIVSTNSAVFTESLKTKGTSFVS